MEIALLIPLFQPRLSDVSFLKSLDTSAFADVLVVDDGSGDNYLHIFQEIAAIPNFSLLSYSPNGGKGHALKAGLLHLLSKHPLLNGIVTADGDAQHKGKDIANIAAALEDNPSSLILGSRDFSKKHVPFHNRLGNQFTRGYFALTTGHKLKDTQTGLRGIPSNLFPLFLKAEGERYDFEMNFLSSAVRNAKVVEVPIETIYQSDGVSHFRPLVDSLRIYRVPLLYILVSLLSAGIDLTLFYFFSSYLPLSSSLALTFLSTCLSRIVSGSFNFAGLYLFVFPRGEFKSKIGRYAIVFSVNLLLSFGFTYLFSYLPSSLTFIKFVVDFVLFVLNFIVSQGFTFAGKRAKAKKIAKESAAKKGERI